MTTIKLITLAIIFILSGGSLFSDYFKKHKFLLVSATIISIVSSYYLFQSIRRDIINDVLHSQKQELSQDFPNSNEIEKSVEKLDEDSSSAKKSEKPNENGASKTGEEDSLSGSENNLLLVTAPPHGRYVMPTISDKKSSEKKLYKISEKSNNVTDDEDWWIGNKLDPETYTVPNPFRHINGDIPNYIPRKYKGNILVKAIKGEFSIAIYGKNFSEGRYVLIMDSSSQKIKHSLDFIHYTIPKSFMIEDKDFIDMSVSWAHYDGRVLYVSHSHSTYSKSSNGFNAYITAIDVNSNRILWRTEPLVCNSSNFFIEDDVIVSGYGFTNEKDYLYVLCRLTGNILQKTKIKTAADFIVEKDNLIYVRTYNMDYIFKLK